MLSGVLLIVILIIFILQGTLSGTNNTLQQQQGTFNQTTTTDIALQHAQCLPVAVNGSGVNLGNGGTAPCCILNGAAAIANCNGAGQGCAGMASACVAGTTVNCPSGRFNRKIGKCA
jgi:hypothetical protein